MKIMGGLCKYCKAHLFWFVYIRKNSSELFTGLKVSANERTTEKQLPGLVEKGLKQIVDNQYDASFRANPSIRTILHWSIAFCKKSCLAKAIVAYEQ